MMFHVQQPKSEAYRRHLDHLRWLRTLDLPPSRRGPPRPDTAERNRRRHKQRRERFEAEWLAFKARSDARAAAWQVKHPPQKAAAYKRAWRARWLGRSPERAEVDRA
jgi:hypothetical protein